MLMLRMLRVESGMTAYEFSKRAKISPARLSYIERGIEQATEDELARIAKVLAFDATRADALLAPVDPVRLREAVEIGPRE